MSDIRSALQDAFDGFNAPDVAEAIPNELEASAGSQKEINSVSTESDKPLVARDEHGRFLKNEKLDNSRLSDEVVTVVEPMTKASRNPFSSWKPDAQSALFKAERGEALTADELKLIRVEAERRESDFHKGVSEFKSHSERAKAYDAAIAPYQQHLQKIGVDAPTAIDALMRADVILRTSDPLTKAQYFSKLAKEYGIDIGQVQQPSTVDPQTQYLLDQLQQLRQTQELWQNQFQSQERLKAQQEIEQFATEDKTHFDAVRNDMADLLESGKAKSMQEAYDMAIWMRPDIRSALIEQQRAEAQRNAIGNAQAQRAKTAAGSVKGSSPVAGGVQPVKGSLREIIEASFAENS